MIAKRKCFDLLSNSFDLFLKEMYGDQYGEFVCGYWGLKGKTESIRKLSKFNFQWTKILYQNNLKDIAFFFSFFKGQRYNKLSVVTPKKISHGSPRK